MTVATWPRYLPVPHTPAANSSVSTCPLRCTSQSRQSSSPGPAARVLSSLFPPPSGEFDSMDEEEDPVARQEEFARASLNRLHTRLEQLAVVRKMAQTFESAQGGQTPPCAEIQTSATAASVSGRPDLYSSAQYTPEFQTRYPELGNAAAQYTPEFQERYPGLGNAAAQQEVPIILAKVGQEEAAERAAVLESARAEAAARASHRSYQSAAPEEVAATAVPRADTGAGLGVMRHVEAVGELRAVAARTRLSPRLGGGMGRLPLETLGNSQVTPVPRTPRAFGDGAGMDYEVGRGAEVPETPRSDGVCSVDEVDAAVSRVVDLRGAIEKNIALYKSRTPSTLEPQTQQQQQQQQQQQLQPSSFPQKLSPPGASLASLSYGHASRRVASPSNQSLVSCKSAMGTLDAQGDVVDLARKIESVQTALEMERQSTADLVVKFDIQLKQEKDAHARDVAQLEEMLRTSLEERKRMTGELLQLKNGEMLEFGKVSSATSDCREVSSSSGVSSDEPYFKSIATMLAARKRKPRPVNGRQPSPASKMIGSPRPATTGSSSSGAETAFGLSDQSSEECASPRASPNYYAGVHKLEFPPLVLLEQEQEVVDEFFQYLDRYV